MRTEQRGAPRALAIALLTGALWIVWLAAFRDVPPSHAVVPSELVGRWQTEDPRYLDRFLQINSESVIWGQGEGQLGEQLFAVESPESEGHPIYVLVVGASWEESRRVPFYFDGLDSLYPVHRREVRWRRVPAGSSGVVR